MPQVLGLHLGSSMPSKLKRYYGFGHLHFLTFSCYQRRALLQLPEARDFFVASLAEIRQRYGFRLIGYVVMPEHVHLLVSEPACRDISVAMKSLKQRISRDLRGRYPESNLHLIPAVIQDAGAGGPRFWEARFYDFNVYTKEKVREKLEYMHGNPVKRGLVGHQRDWMWSSYEFYEMGKAGMIAIDSADFEFVDRMPQVQNRHLGHPAADRWNERDDRGLLKESL